MKTKMKTIATSSLCDEGLLPIFPDSAQFLGIGRSAMFKLLRTAKIPYVRIGTERKIPKRALIEFAERNLVVRECD